MNKKDTLITIIIAVLCVALVAGIIVYKNLDKEDVAPTVAHDHDGDGVADHDDSYHQTTGTTSGNDKETTGTTGTTNAADQEDGDIPVDIGALPTDNTTGTGSSTGN